MKRSSKGRQAGISFFGLIIVMGVLACLGILAAQAAPSAVEYQAIVKAVERAKDGTTPQEVRAAFDRAATVDDIKSIHAIFARAGDYTAPIEYEVDRLHDGRTFGSDTLTFSQKGRVI